ncbi:4,5-dihydroxyphthalate decarboxylase [Pigmentiphaga humi]|uniref:4,5-dihydroxyphthalate decarboxylase n=1 Tax=Pigmentiphaga humi TaxID=2478468 RepID=A0A3P4B9U4_9BURK|nr:PhnD/SsuA/transferrin family substrate-binding protein [Pigmentiphaga humi]VCU71905.1 4,5-dihydroxyphthalate decarboxylase [Pigmentiphaga humi]
MANISLSLAVGEYDHVRDLASGDVRASGLEIHAVHGPIEDILVRGHRYKEWDVAETGLGAYVAAIDRGDDSIIAIPVFTSRIFRHSAIYVRADSGISSPAQLVGRKVGVPEWGMAAAVYARGALVHQYGMDLRTLHWVQGGLHDPGREDRSPPDPELGLDYRQETASSLNDLLAAGELDALISARVPRVMQGGSGRVRHLFGDPRTEELNYWSRTGVFPIMHLIGIRRDVYERNRWVAMQLLKGFEEAKRRSLERAADLTASYFPVPLMAYAVEQARSVAGQDYWPYGVEANRPTLEAFLQYAFEQGVTRRRIEVEELFARECLTYTKT